MKITSGNRNLLLVEVIPVLLLAASDYIQHTLCSTASAGISFSFTNLSSQLIDCRGDAFLRGGDLTLVRSTSQNSYGWGVYHESVQFLNDSNTNAMVSFQTSFTFSIEPKGDTPPFADGMAFIIVPTNEGPPLDSYGEFLGVYTPHKNESARNRFFEVEFDTYQNFDLQDPSDSHIGIDINTMESNMTYDTSSNQSALNLKKNGTVTAWIEYDSPSQTTEVRMANGSVPERPETALLSLQYDLSSILQPSMYVGFSGATGLKFELQIVHTWSFSTSRKFFAAAPQQVHRHHCWNSNLCTGLVVVGIGLGLLAACVLLVGGWWLYNKSKKLHFSRSLDGGPQRYTYRELSRATKGFSTKNVIGRGAFGCVYKGRLPRDGQEVALKKISEANSEEGERGFVSEITIISQLRHRNLVQLQGWCHERSNLLLVYEYLPNGSLDQLLYGKAAGGGEFTWGMRYKAMVGVAAALAYLHEGWEKKVVHRDVKASNVMLDGRNEARLGDFGLARMMEHTKRVKMLTMAGTLGYLAPEAAYTGKATDKSDVYSFGVLLLEVVTSKRPLDTRSTASGDLQSQWVLLDWVWAAQELGQLLRVVDPTLQALYDPDEVTRSLQLGLLCCHPLPQARPSMNDVLQILKKQSPLLPLPKSRPSPYYIGTSPSTHLFHSPHHETLLLPNSASPDPPIRSPFLFSDALTLHLLGHVPRGLSDVDTVEKFSRGFFGPLLPGRHRHQHEGFSTRH